MTEDGLLWRTKPRKTVQVFQSAPDPEAEAARIAFKQEQEFERHVIDVMKARYLAEFDEPAPEAEPAPVEEHKFPAPHEKLTDWDVVGVGDASGTIPSDIASKLAGIGISPKAGETMPAFTARLRAHYNDIAGKRHAGIGDIPVIDAEMEIISVVLNELIALTPKAGG